MDDAVSTTALAQYPPALKPDVAIAEEAAEDWSDNDWMVELTREGFNAQMYCSTML